MIKSSLLFIAIGSSACVEVPLPTGDLVGREYACRVVMECLEAGTATEWGDERCGPTSDCVDGIAELATCDGYEIPAACRRAFQ